jgi:hypothetical protein
VNKTDTIVCTTLDRHNFASASTWNVDSGPDADDVPSLSNGQSAFEVAIAIIRGASKFIAVYGQGSPQIEEFITWCRTKEYITS